MWSFSWVRCWSHPEIVAGMLDREEQCSIWIWIWCWILPSHHIQIWCVIFILYHLWPIPGIENYLFFLPKIYSFTYIVDFIGLKFCLILMWEKRKNVRFSFLSLAQYWYILFNCNLILGAMNGIIKIIFWNIYMYYSYIYKLRGQRHCVCTNQIPIFLTPI